MVILPDTTTDGALAVAESFRQALADLDIPLAGGAIRVTASVGVASVIPDSVAQDELAALVGAADAALYQAKEAGRNQVRQGYLRVAD